MVRHTLSNLVILRSWDKISPGRDQYSRHAKFLFIFLNLHHQDFADIGVDVDKIGSHSALKGSATHAWSGTTASATIVAICKRAYWTSGVKERYLMFDGAGDEYLGTIVVRLLVLEKEISSSPPLFKSKNF